MAVDLGKQIGPLPLGGWLIAVAGGVGIAVWSRTRGGEEEPVIVEDTSGEPGVGEGAATPGFIPINPPNTTPGDNVTETYESNAEWARAAIAYLIAQGYDAGIANSAITKAISGGQDVEGNKMSIQEWTLWTIALKKLGSPPEPVFVQPPTSVPGPVIPAPPPPVVKPPAPKPTPTPTPKPTPAPTRPRYRVITIGPTTRSLSAAVAAYNRRYGTRVTWQDVWNFNLRWRSASTVATLKKRGPNKVYIGSTFWVPY